MQRTEEVYVCDIKRCVSISLKTDAGNWRGVTTVSLSLPKKTLHACPDHTEREILQLVARTFPLLGEEEED